MRKYPLLAALILLVLVLAACAAGTPQAPTPAPTPEPPTATPVPQEVAAPAPAYFGTFTASLPAADTPGRTLTAQVAEDGTVQVSSDYQNGQPPIVETGTWTANPDGGLTVTLTEQDGQPYFEPQTFQVALDEATGEITVTGRGGTAFQMTPVAAEPEREVTVPTPAEEAPQSAEDLAGAYALAGPDGGVLTFVLAGDGVLRASIDYPDGTPSTVISGTWQVNDDGSAMATLTEQDGQTFDPQELQLKLDTTTDELVLTAITGEQLRLARTTSEPAAAPAETTPVTSTATMTTTEAVTPTVPVTATAAMTPTVAVTLTEGMTPTVAVTSTEAMSATAPVTVTEAVTPAVVAVAETLENTYITTVPVGADGDSRLVALHLNPDGTIRLASDFQVDERNTVALGTWQDNGDGTLTVTVTGPEDQPFETPEVVTLKQDGDSLVEIADSSKPSDSPLLTLRRASDVAESLNTALININLQAGFPLDPTFVSVNAGGEVDASLLINECEGFINTQPVVTVEWSGEASFIKAFFVSDDDPTMVVGTPDGKVLCNDDATDQLLDPRIRIDDPITGTYKIWLGSYSRGQLIPGVLVLTTREDVTLASFDLGSFVARPALPEEAAEPTPVASPSVTTTAMLKVEAPELTAETPITRSVVASGTVPMFQLDVEDPTCQGLVTVVPDLIFRWAGEADQLRVYFEGDTDATLLVYAAEGETVTCADNVDDANANPLVTIDTPAAGLYGVWVGRFDPSRPITGVLTVTADAEATPAVLEPAKPDMANPASVYCVQEGGKVDIRTAADGSQTGFCVFPDGSECDEWAFLRGECKPGSSK